MNFVGDSLEQQHWQEQILQKIAQQIKSISSVPQAQRKKMLSSLIQEASTAAEHCDVNTRDQLLELAAFARKARAKEPAGQKVVLPFPEPLRALHSSFRYFRQCYRD